MQIFEGFRLCYSGAKPFRENVIVQLFTLYFFLTLSEQNQGLILNHEHNLVSDLTSCLSFPKPKNTSSQRAKIRLDRRD